MTRETKTAAQRAQEALDVAQRRVDRIEKTVLHHEELVRNYTKQLTEARQRRDYAASNPDLRDPS